MRGKILSEAIKIINGERQDQYGDPEDAFADIAVLWEWWLSFYDELTGVPFIAHRAPTAKDVPIMMTLLKLAREKHQKKRDNLRDAAGYLGLAGDMEE